MEVVKRQIAFVKKYRELIQIEGDFYRLRSPFEGNDTAWLVVSRDRTQAVAGFYQRLNKTNASWLRLQLQGLEEDMLYEVSCDVTPVSIYDEERAGLDGNGQEKERVKKYRAYGAELMYAGIPVDRRDLDRKGGDFASLIYTITKCI